jgi:pyruvate formate lyase activating enzyme
MMKLGIIEKIEKIEEIFFREKKEGFLLYKPGNIDFSLFKTILSKYALTPESKVLVLPYGEENRVGWETRRLYFSAALSPNGKFNREAKIVDREKCQNPPITRIISFGRCNIRCPYCKRDCQFINEEGIPIFALPIPLRAIAELGEGAIERGEIIRFSGGDPVMYPRETLALGEYFWKRHGVKVSIAHNGSGPNWVKKMLPYLSSAAIDLKGVPEKIGKIMGIPEEKGPKFYQLSLETQRLISYSNVLLEVRTPIFGDTSYEEMVRLGEDIVKTNNLDYTFWTWRLYKPVVGCNFPVPEKEKVIEMMKEVSKKFPYLWMGMRAKWERGGMIFFREGKLINVTSDAEEKYDLEFGSGNRLSRVK